MTVPTSFPTAPVALPRPEPPAPPARARQRSFDELGPALRDVTFCVLDLETTGGSAQGDAITEIGAVKVRGGEGQGTLQTLVNPGRAIPPQITLLTGISEAMVLRAPRIESVLPTLLEFIGDAVIVGHNVRFDLGFLNAALARDQRPRLANSSIDTCALARRLLRDDVPNCKLDTLASRLRLDHRPTHRALDDALATADLLHVLIERAAGLGVTGLDDLIALPTLSQAAQLSKLRLTDRLPRSMGVYLFRNAQGEIIYVGKASNLRARVRSYFASDTRRKVGNLLRELAAVDHIECRGSLETTVLELRLIQRHQPRYNSAGRRRAAPVFVVLTDERFPRLTTARRAPGPERPALGPMAPRLARAVIDAVESAVPIRRCSSRPERATCATPCAPAQLGVATCPCSGAIDEPAYAPLAERVRRGLSGDPEALLSPLRDRMHALAAAERYEDAASARDRAAVLAGALRRQQRVRALVSSEQLVIAVDGEGRAQLENGRLVTRFDHLSTERTPFDIADEVHCIALWLDRNARRVELVRSAGAYAERLPCIPAFTARG